MIRSFKDKRTEALIHGEVPRGIDARIVKRVQRVLMALDEVSKPTDLWKVPGYRAEKLGGDRAGQWSLRVNDQWRICYRWTDEGPEDVELTDYH